MRRLIHSSFFADISDAVCDHTASATALNPWVHLSDRDKHVMQVVIPLAVISYPEHIDHTAQLIIRLNKKLRCSWHQILKNDYWKVYMLVEVQILYKLSERVTAMQWRSNKIPHSVDKIIQLWIYNEGDMEFYGFSSVNVVDWRSIKPILFNIIG